MTASLLQARKALLWKMLCQGTDCAARDSSHSTAQHSPEGVQWPATNRQPLSGASPVGPTMLTEAAGSAGAVADAQPTAVIDSGLQRGAVQTAEGEPDEDMQDASGEDLRSSSGASQASSGAGPSAATSTGSALSTDPPDPRCPADFANTCTYLKPRGPFARAGEPAQVPNCVVGHGPPGHDLELHLPQVKSQMCTGRMVLLCLACPARSCVSPVMPALSWGLRTDLHSLLYLLGVQGICLASGLCTPSLAAAMTTSESWLPLLKLPWLLRKPPCLLRRGRAEGVACTPVGWPRRDATCNWAAACQGTG